MKLKILAALVILAGLGTAAYAGEVKIKTTKVEGRLVDDISLPFVNDPAVLGEWESVDFVRTPAQFVPGKPGFTGERYLKVMKFLPDGVMAWAIESGETAVLPFMAWTKGVVMHRGGDKTASRYTIKEISGALYLFFEWKSGDYIIRHQKPRYYVLKKK